MITINELRERTGLDIQYLVLSGSHSHGLATPESDEDVRGVYVPNLRDMIDGFGRAPVVTINDGDTDVVLQPIHKFIALCARSNPNILDWLFMPLDCVLDCWILFGSRVLSNRDRFLTKAMYPRYRGYAQSHFNKMTRGVTGDIGAKRKADIERHGYSTKNAMHLIRLLRMGSEALETGVMNVRRTEDREELLAIRRGEWTLARVTEEGGKLMERLNRAVKTSTLPERMEMEDAAKMVLDMTGVT